jgi:hypothetical protein
LIITTFKFVIWFSCQIGAVLASAWIDRRAVKGVKTPPAPGWWTPTGGNHGAPEHQATIRCSAE